MFKENVCAIVRKNNIGCVLFLVRYLEEVVYIVQNVENVDENKIQNGNFKIRMLFFDIVRKIEYKFNRLC